MDLGLSGRSVIVTGASRGIGRSIAEGFAAEGAHLTICARGAETLESTRAALEDAARLEDPDARTKLLYTLATTSPEFGLL